MWKWLLIITLLAVGQKGHAFWEKKAFYERQTQSVRVDLKTPQGEGVLFLKHFKYNSPVYLISTYENQTITKTMMVSEVNFYKMYDNFHGWVSGSPEQQVQGCEVPLSVTVTLKEEKAEKKDLCGDGVANKSNEPFTKWLNRLKERL